MRPTINSEKRIVQFGIDTTLAGTVRALHLVSAVNTPVNAEDVPIGAVVKAIYVELWLMSDTQQLGSQIAFVEKTNQNSAPANFSQSAALNGYANKKNVLQTTQGLTGDANSNPIPAFRGWIKIPKGKQRFGQGDDLWLVVSAIVEDTASCGLAIFKSYT